MVLHQESRMGLQRHTAGLRQGGELERRRAEEEERATSHVLCALMMLWSVGQVDGGGKEFNMHQKKILKNRKLFMLKSVTH